jgi:hypothetical protein
MLSYYEGATRPFSSRLPFQRRHRHRSLDPTTISEPAVFVNSHPQNPLHDVRDRGACKLQGIDADQALKIMIEVDQAKFDPPVT